MARLVNKQFNSPIGLYSEQNIREVIQRESQILSNGAVGINFNNPGAGKPTNLQNSAVLRMLEEEEQRQRSTQQSPSLKRVAWPPPQEGENFVEQTPVQSQGGPQYSPSPNLQNNYSPAQQQAFQRSPLKPLDISNGTINYNQPVISPVANQSAVGFRPATPSKQWAPVQSPVATPGQAQYRSPQQNPQSYQSAPQYQTVSQPYQPPHQQYQPPQQQNPQSYQSAPQYQAVSQPFQPPHQQYQPPQQQFQPQYQPPEQQYQPPQQQVSTRWAAAPNQVAPSQQQQQQQSYQPAVKKVEPPPTTITLRPQAPVSQAPPPVVTSQPATATLKGGKHLRGDLKWPPENVRRLMEQERRHLEELAKGPAIRPPSNIKDYTPFFEQHALNSTYPGYKIPPGTQFYEHTCAH